MAPPLKGVYINLDRASDRRTHMEAELARFGLSDVYERLPAVDGRSYPKRAGDAVLRPGEIATFESHYRAVKRAAAGEAYLHVMEDDAALSAWLRPVTELLVRTGALSVFDMVFLSFQMMPEPMSLRRLQGVCRDAFGKAEPQSHDFKLIDIAADYVWASDSYIINPLSAAKLEGICEREWQAQPKMGIDVFFAREIRAGRIRAGAVLPFLTSLAPAHADQSLADRRGQSERAAFFLGARLLREVFFIDRDLPELMRQAEQLASEIVPKEPAADMRTVQALAGVLLNARLA